MFNRQTLIALGVAVVLGLVAVFLANSFLSGKQQQAYAGGTTKVAVAAVPLAYGTDITPDKIRFVDYPNSSIPPGAFTTAAQLLPAGQEARRAAPDRRQRADPGQQDFREGQGASIAALLPDGMRAATVRINDVSGVAGFVQPNDSVDVLITRQAAPTRTAGHRRAAAERPRASRSTSRRRTPTARRVARTATLEVAPIDAQKLALAQEVGSLSLVLRKPGEENNPVVETVSMNDLRYNMYGGARYPAPAVVGGFGSAWRRDRRVDEARRRRSPLDASRPVRRAPAPKAKPAAPVDNGKQIEVYRGTNSNQVKVGG